LSAIGGRLEIAWNDSLQNLTGLENLTNINGDLSLSWVQLNTLNGLEGLTHIGGNFVLNAIGNLQDLTGLENLTSIGGRLQFGSIGTGSSGGTSLVSLAGLEGLDSIGGGAGMVANGQLSSISALDGLTYLGGHLSILLNHSLAACQSDWLCDYLLAPNGSVNIMDNAPGCNSIVEVGSNCSDSIPCLPYGNYFLTTQEDIDNFQNVFPGCVELEGDLNIFGSWFGKSCYSTLDSDIFNLNGLNVITSLGGWLSISDNGTLTTLTGLDEVTAIGGGLWIGNNDVLHNLTGLEALESIGDDLIIGWNDSLTSLTGLEGLTSIGGELRIDNNDALTSLMGLDNIWSGTIEQLSVFSNILLSSCAVESVCAFMTIPYGNINISNNASGCNSLEEVQEACDSSYFSFCLPEGITFTSQEQIDSFHANYPGCNAILGFVNVNGDDITNLEGLDQVNFIGGNMEIRYNDALSNLSGLDSLITLMGGLWIDHNNALTSLTGLEGLTSIGEFLWIGMNNTLTNLAGLEGLTYIGDFLRVSGNDALQSLTGVGKYSSSLNR